MRFSRTPATAAWSAPEIGQHNDHVLRELLGLTDEEITEPVIDEAGVSGAAQFTASAQACCRVAGQISRAASLSVDGLGTLAHLSIFGTETLLAFKASESPAITIRCTSE
jgi:hypothetical protein